VPARTKKGIRKDVLFGVALRSVRTKIKAGTLFGVPKTKPSKTPTPNRPKTDLMTSGQRQSPTKVDSNSAIQFKAPSWVRKTCKPGGK